MKKARLYMWRMLLKRRHAETNARGGLRCKSFDLHGRGCTEGIALEQTASGKIQGIPRNTATVRFSYTRGMWNGCLSTATESRDPVEIIGRQASPPH
eukprot:6177696-Pleurochrysis_carterae.AAC.1